PLHTDAPARHLHPDGPAPHLHADTAARHFHSHAAARHLHPHAGEPRLRVLRPARQQPWNRQRPALRRDDQNAPGRLRRSLPRKASPSVPTATSTSAVGITPASCALTGSPEPSWTPSFRQAAEDSDNPSSSSSAQTAGSTSPARAPAASCASTP